jgi:glutamate-1-semialdehyde 2,1-aminomutase
MDYSKRLHNVIPGGAHTYSRGDDQFPSNAPSILKKGNGAYVWDQDDNLYLDYGMGLRSVNLGYANQEVVDEMYKEALNGNNLTRATLTELKAAELLVDTIDSVEMVKFAKHGSSVTSAAIKLARAYTGRKYICVPYEHPFFSFDDWFIGTTPLTRGIPEENSTYTLKFHYNDISSLEKLFTEYPGQIAAVMLEPATTISPCNDNCKLENKNICRNCLNNKDNFLYKVQNICRSNNSIFILDEMITGFRWHIKGAQYYYGVDPDLCTFGKAMANGFAVAALGGKKEIMSIGGIKDEGTERVFLTSTTHGAEMSGLGAFIKTIEILKRDNVINHFWDYGKRLIDGMNNISKELGIEKNFFVEGYPCSPNYITKDEKLDISLAFRTLFSQEMIKNKVLMPYISLSFSHKEKELEITLKAVKNSLEIYKKALLEGISNYLESSVIKPVFRKYN